MIFVNFKTYSQGTGTEAISLTELLEEIAHESQMKIIPVVQATDIKELTQVSKLEIWTQHIDPVEFGAHTGSILAEAVYEDGAIGSFLNHSEHKFRDFEQLERSHKRATDVGLKTLVFAADIDELKLILRLNPTYVAYEPPELVGSKTTSVSQEKPEVISEAVELARARQLPLVVGAGIKSQEDVRVSVALGAVGIAVASDIVTAKDPKKEILDLIEGFK